MMTSVTPAAAGGPAPPPPPPGAPTAVNPVLPEPLLEGALPLDALARLLTMAEQQGLATMSVTERRLAHTQEQLRAKLDELLKQLSEAARRAEEDGHKRRKGLFGKAAEVLGDVTAKLVGASVEVLHDSVTVPADLVVSVVEHAGNWQAMQASLREDLAGLKEQSDMQRSFEGFVEGTTRFAATLFDFSSTLALSLASGGARGDALDSILAERGGELWDSFKENILENPAFWETVGTLAKAAAVAGTVMSGGTLGVLAIALLVVLEADKRYAVIEKTAGQDAAPYVRVGVAIAFAVCTAAAAGGGEMSQTVKLLEAGSGLVSGAGAMYQGVREISEGDRQADALELQAAVQQTQDQLAQLQRLVDSLLELLKDRSESHRTTRELASSLSQAAAAVEGAVVMKA